MVPKDHGSRLGTDVGGVQVRVRAMAGVGKVLHSG